jgi:hypothetical protein
MALGQAAGTAADLCLDLGREPRDLDVPRLQRQLLESAQVITYFSDLEPNDVVFKAVQYFGTRGFFDDYQARSREPLPRRLARRWLELSGTRVAGAGRSARRLTAPASWKGEESLTHAELAALLGVGAEHWVYEDGRRQQANTPVWRGEFCRALYHLTLAGAP